MHKHRLAKWVNIDNSVEPNEQLIKVLTSEQQTRLLAEANTKGYLFADENPWNICLKKKLFRRKPNNIVGQARCVVNRKATHRSYD